MNISSTKDRFVNSKRVEFLYSNAPTIFVGPIAIFLVLVYAMRDVIPHGVLAGWLAVNLLIKVFQYALVYAYKKTSPGAEESYRWGRYYRVVTFCSGMALGSAGVLLFAETSFYHQTILIILLGIVAIGATGAYVIDLKSALAFSVPTVTPVVIKFMVQENDVHTLIASAMFAVFFVMILVIRKVNSYAISHLIDNIETTELHRELADKTLGHSIAVGEVGILREINNAINIGWPLDRVLFLAAEKVRALHNYAACDIYLYDRGLDELTLTAFSLDFKHLEAVEKMTGLKAQGLKIPLYEGSSYYEAIRNRKSVALSDMTKAFSDFTDKPTLQAMAGPVARFFGFNSAVRAPIVEGDEVIGLIGATRKEPMSIDDARVLELFASQLALTIKKAKSEESLSFLIKAIETTKTGITLSDMQGIIRYINSADAKMHGYEPEEIIGKKANIMAPPELRKDRLGKVFLDAFKHMERESINVSKDGSRFPVRLISDLVKSEGGDPIGVVTICEDITEIKRIEGELRKSHEELERKVEERTHDLKEAMKEAQEANEAKSQFLANISHEIRTPLNSIIGFSELMLAQPCSGTGKAQANMILEESETLLFLINDILDLEKSRAGKLSILKQPFSFERLLHQVHRTISVQADAKGLDFVIDAPEDIHDCMLGDDFRLRQVLLNLLNNAIKFTEKGSVSLTISMPEQAPIPIIYFEVKDTGIGIEENMQERLFESFTQLDSTSTRRYGGTGLGTAIAKRLVELMGGEIGVKSASAQGSTFWFRIPLPKCFSGILAEKAAETAAIHPVSKPISVLLTEDYPPTQELITAHLENFGCNVQVAENGAKALQYAADKDYEIIVMDVQMPEMDGLEATRRILEIKPDSVIIGLTANADKESLDSCRAVGMRDAMTKPVRRITLYNAIITWSGHSGIEMPDQKLVDPKCKINEHLPIDLDQATDEFEGNQDLLKSLVHRFIEAVETQAVKVNEMHENGNLRGIRAEAHSIKGGASNLVAVPLASAARELEEAARDGKRDEVTKALAGFNEALGTLKQYVLINMK